MKLKVFNRAMFNEKNKYYWGRGIFGFFVWFFFFFFVCAFFMAIFVTFLDISRREGNCGKSSQR